MVTIQRNQIASLADAILQIQPTATRPLNLPKKARYALMKDLRIFHSRITDMERHRLSIIRRLSPEKFAIEKDTPEAVAFTKEWEAYQNGNEEIENLFMVKLSDLNVYDPKENPEGNDIPIAALAKLGPIIEEDES